MTPEPRKLKMFSLQLLVGAKPLLGLYRCKQWYNRLTVVCMSNCQHIFAEFFLIRPNSVTISSGAFYKYNYLNEHPQFNIHPTAAHMY